jgi:hypothetical protein
MEVSKRTKTLPMAAPDEVFKVIDSICKVIPFKPSRSKIGYALAVAGMRSLVQGDVTLETLNYFYSEKLEKVLGVKLSEIPKILSGGVP